MNGQPTQPHPLPYNIFNEDERQRLGGIIEQRIRDDDTAHRKYIEEWDEVDDRLNGEKTPSGYSLDHIVALAQGNSPLIGEKEKSKIRTFVNAPQARPIHESNLGNFINVRRKLTVRANNPTDSGKARVFQKRVEHIENVQMLPEEIYFPLMDQAWAKGLMWAEGLVNPFARELRGKQEWKVINCRDVLVDNHAQGMFFNTRRWDTLRFKVSIEEAKDTMLKYPHFYPEKLHGDNDYDIAWQRQTDRLMQSDFATFYNHQFRRKVCSYVIETDNGELKPITPQQYAIMVRDPRLAERVHQIGEDEEYYIVLYHRTLGVLDLRRNDAGMFTRIPLVNISTDSRLYPLGDQQVSKNLFDLLNVLLTVFLQNAKKANKPIGEIDESVWDDAEKLAVIDAALEHGGSAPGLKGIHNVQPINSYLIQMLPLTLQMIQDLSSRHSASMGEVPSQQIAKATVDTIIAKDRQAHSRKDIMLKWTLTNIHRLMVKYIALYDTESDFMPLFDSTPGSPNYIPINKLWTRDEYVANLAMMARLTPPQAQSPDDQADPERSNTIQANNDAEAQFAEQINAVRMQFESVNDVKVVEMDGYIVQGMEMTDQDIMDQADQLGVSLEAFVAMYRPEPAKIQMFKVNDLHEEAELSVVSSIDTDYQNSPEYREQRAFALFDRGVYPMVDLLKDTNVQDPENVAKRAIMENQAKQLALDIAKDPELFQQVMAGIQKGQGASKNGQKKPQPQD